MGYLNTGISDESSVSVVKMLRITDSDREKPNEYDSPTNCMRSLGCSFRQVVREMLAANGFDRALRPFFAELPEPRRYRLISGLR